PPEAAVGPACASGSPVVATRGSTATTRQEIADIRSFSSILSITSTTGLLTSDASRRNVRIPRLAARSPAQNTSTSAPTRPDHGTSCKWAWLLIWLVRPASVTGSGAHTATRIGASSFASLTCPPRHKLGVNAAHRAGVSTQGGTPAEWAGPLQQISTCAPAWSPRDVAGTVFAVVFAGRRVGAGSRRDRNGLDQFSALWCRASSARFAACAGPPGQAEPDPG